MASGDRLTGLDSSFLHLEDGPAHMHVASTTVFEGPAPDIEELREHILSRLHLVPRFRQKLKFVPYGQGRPIWIDDPQFNLDYHVRHTALPEPGSEQQLRTLAARIFSQRLDRSKPLWEMWLVTASTAGASRSSPRPPLPVDGVSGVDITTVLFDASPTPPPPTPRTGSRGRSHPTPRSWAAPSPSARRRRPRLLRGVRAVIPPAPARGAGARGRPRVSGRAGPRWRSGPGFALQRRDQPVQALRMGPRRPRRLQAHQEHSRRHRQRRRAGRGRRGARALPARPGSRDGRARAQGDGPDQRPPAPTSTATSATRSARCTRRCPSGIEDPAERLRAVSAGMGDLKESKQAVGATLLTELADFAPPTIIGQAGRLAVAPALLQHGRDQRPGAAVPALPHGARALGALSDGPARQAPGRLLRDHELQRPGQLRPHRRLRGDGRPRLARA